MKHPLTIPAASCRCSPVVQESLPDLSLFACMIEGLLGGRVDLLDAGITGIFELLEVVAVLFNEGDRSFEMAEFGGIIDPFEVDCL